MTGLAAPVRRAFLAGGGGFLGAWIIRRLLAAGTAVRVLEPGTDRRILRMILGDEAGAVDWVRGDVSDAAAVTAAAEGCDALINLAGLLTPACQRDPVRGAMVNVIGTLSVFEAAREHRIGHVVYASSGGVYAPDDDAEPRPTTHYGAFKLANEGSARAYLEDAGISSTGFRPFVVYGPGRESGLTAGISLACRAAAEGADYTIPFRGPVALIHADDVAAAFVAATFRQPPGAHTVNLTGQLTTVEEAVATIREIAPGARLGVDGPSIPSSASPPNEWATCGLDLGQERPLRDGLAETVAFYRGLEGGRAGARC